MLGVYSLLLTISMILMSPLLLLRRQKYSSGFRERLGNYPKFFHDDREVIWLHCVSVGETNAARPFVDGLIKNFPSHRLVISTTTRTGQELARKIFKDKADAVFYFPFDWKFSVRRALNNFRPSIILLMETEIWPRLIHETKSSGVKVAIVNGRLSEKSFRRYLLVKSFVRLVLQNVDLALMQGENDGERIMKLGIEPKKVKVTGNLKFEHTTSDTEEELTALFRHRFNISHDKPLIIAASTHEPEERYVLESLDGELGHSCRLMIAPRHPERFNAVERLLGNYAYSFVKRSAPPAEADGDAAVILLDTIGELRAAYPLAEIVFVGGSLVRHGGQNVLEPAAVGKAIVTGPHTENFDVVIKEFLENDAIRQTPSASDDSQISERLYEEFIFLLGSEQIRLELGRNAAAVMGKSNRGATAITIDSLRAIIDHE